MVKKPKRRAAGPVRTGRDAPPKARSRAASASLKDERAGGRAPRSKVNDLAGEARRRDGRGEARVQPQTRVEPSGAGDKGPWAATVTLPERLEATLMSGHPWVFREQLLAVPACPAGAWVRVLCGRISAFGLWDPESALAVRIYSREAVPTKRLFEQRVARAWALRAETLDLANTSAVRWVNGEGDGLPGFIVDYYAGYAVVVLDSAACLPHLPWLVDALTQCQPLRGVLRRRRGSETTVDTTERVELLHGKLPPRDLIVEEHGIRFRANVFEGQKTALFLDHRENRRFLGQYCEGRSVLNLFSYSGGFSLYAARGGASRTVSVDIAPGAGDDARENFKLNGLAGDAHEFVTADVFDFLEQLRKRGEVFDVVVCDPPSFARNQTQLDRALAAYTRVNAAALKVVADGGFYAAASCTARVSNEAFASAVADAARRARRDFQLIAARAHATDHPVALAHPEQRYLKFLFGRIHQRT